MICSDHLIVVSLLVLIDLSAAVDTIDHNILLNRLENYVAISGIALAWLKSYLSDRYQIAAVNLGCIYTAGLDAQIRFSDYIRFFFLTTCLHHLLK